MSNATRGLPTTKTKADLLPEFYHDHKKGCYPLKIKTGQFLSLGKEDMVDHLRMAKIQGLDTEDKFGLKEASKQLALCRMHRSVDYVGPLAGYRAGIFTTQAGQKVLVTSEIQPVEPKKGDCPKLQLFFEQLCGEQSTYVFLWMKLAYESLLNGDFRPGPMLVMAGPTSCGKSLFQDLFTYLLGGRVARPYSYMTGQTDFNTHIASAEHQLIGDEQVNLDIRSRRNFGAAIKDLTVNPQMSVHAKGRDITITVPTYKRVTLSVNDQPEDLAILPPLNDSLLDKIALVKCERAELGTDRLKIWRGFSSEMPAFVHELLEMKVPACMRKNKSEADRFGVDTFHNEELLEMVSDISPETRLLNLIDEVLFGRGEDGEEKSKLAPEFWRGSAMELEKDLRNSNGFGFAVEKLLSFAGACGTYLSRLKTKYPQRFNQTRSNGKTRWTIHP